MVVVETLRSQDAIRDCAQTLKRECENFQFMLDGSYKSAKDFGASHNNYIKSRPSWEKFFPAISPTYKKSQALKRKCDTVFQIMHMNS